MENDDERLLTRELTMINTRELAFGTWTMNYLGEKTKKKKKKHGNDECNGLVRVIYYKPHRSAKVRDSVRNRCVSFVRRRSKLCSCLLAGPEMFLAIVNDRRGSCCFWLQRA